MARFSLCLLVSAASAATVKYDSNSVEATKLPQGNDFQGSLELVSGTRTYDTLRYASTGSFPLTTSFRDSYNHEWGVSIMDSTDEVNLFFPCTNRVNWHGDEEDSTGFDAQCRMCEVKFWYDAGSAMQSHGIRLEAQCYALGSIGYRISGGYDEIIDKVMKGISAASAIADLIDKLPTLPPKEIMLAAVNTVSYDGSDVEATKLPQGNDFQGSLELVSGTRTYDTLRYASTGSFPLTTSFRDSYNHEWKVSIKDSSDEVNLFFPCTNRVNWHGDEEDSTGFDAQCRMCEVKFWYDAGSAMQSHGIRLEAQCYALSTIGYRISGGYDEIIDKVMKGISAAAAIADLISKIPVPPVVV
jgi:hypothetical protein